ncbi:hypothetical protein ACQJBY_053768 [Aegilops geniculata]
METPMDLDPQRRAGDRDGSRSAALETSAVGSGGEMVVAPAGSGATADVVASEGIDSGTNGVASEGSDGGASEGVAPGTNGVASEGSGAGAKVGGKRRRRGAASNSLSAKAAVPVEKWRCHQCRQRKIGVATDCKRCTQRYCESCMHNRYPLIADEVLKKGAWECAKCRKECNCSVCQKKRGEEPTGRVVHATNRPKVNLVQTKSISTLKDEIVVPRGTPVTCIAGIELQSEDVGAAIQFLEFCRSFGEICKIGKGLPEEILKDLTQLEEVSSVVANVHINLLSIIENGKDNPFDKYPSQGDEWTRKVGEYINLTLHAEDFTLRCLNQGVSGYKILNPSCKLEVLNCLCNEALSSKKLRTYIDIEDKKCLARQKIKAATRKQKELKRRHDDMTKTIKGGDIANNEEANDILSQIKEAEEIKKAARNESEELERVHRTAPVMVDNGVKYWKLGGYCNNNTNIMRQEFVDENRTKNKDIWFMFTEDEHKIVEDHVTTR